MRDGTAADQAVVVDGGRMVNNRASIGGALALCVNDGRRVQVRSVMISDNEAQIGGGVFVMQLDFTGANASAAKV